MTEAEWRTCTNLEMMLASLRGKTSDRKLRLFAVACCRCLELDIPDQRSWDAVHVAEWYADGRGSEEDLAAAHRDARASLDGRRNAAVAATAPDPWAAVPGVADSIYWLGWEAAEEGGERLGQIELLRDAFGPLPFRRIALDPRWLAWNDGTVPKLALAIYEDRAFDRLPVLADALEEAGCGCAEILGHCRGPGPHARGCWVVDLLLDKS